MRAPLGGVAPQNQSLGPARLILLSTARLCLQSLGDPPDSGSPGVLPLGVTCTSSLPPPSPPKTGLTSSRLHPSHTPDPGRLLTYSWSI